MSNSLGHRGPDDQGLFVDGPVVLANRRLGLPGDFKLKGFERKWILKRVAARSLPGEVIGRPTGGFGIPVGEWVRRALRGDFEAVLSPQALKDSIWNIGTVERLFREHLIGRRDRYWELWNIYIFERWRRQWMPVL